MFGPRREKCLSRYGIPCFVFPSVVSNLAGEYLFYVRGINDVCRQRANSKDTHIMYELKPLGSAHPARVRRSAYLQDARVRDTGGVDTLHALTRSMHRYAQSFCLRVIVVLFLYSPAASRRMRWSERAGRS